MAENPLRGTGALILDEQRHEGARYEITVTPFGRSKLRTLGILTMSRGDMPVMTAAAMAPFTQLELEGAKWSK